MLTQEKLKELFIYNPDTGEFTHKYSHGRAVIGRAVGTIGNEGYLQIGVSGKIYQAHRLAWLYVYGSNPRFTIDHINGVKTDNSIKNIRDIKQCHNIQNIRNPYKNNKVGILGVRLKGGKYIAQIKFNKKVIHIGTYKTKEDAGRAYLEKKKELHKFFIQKAGVARTSIEIKISGIGEEKTVGEVIDNE